MSPFMRALGMVVGGLLLGAAGCTSDGVPAGQCRYNADCESPQVCVGTTCRAPCAQDSDCPDNGVCARSLAGVSICASRTAPRPCLYSSDCPAATFCTRDGVCQSRCLGDYDCQVINPFNSCVDGACQLVCPAGFADCDADVRNGCEVDLRTSAAHCGSCRNACAGVDGAAGVCRDGACAAQCRAGYADCDGVASNGCEADLGQSDHCGACATRCSGERSLCLVAVEPGTGARSYSCQPECPAGTTMCGSRCVDLQSDPGSCGSCDAACPSGAGAAATCSAGRCGVRCNEVTTQGDCDGVATNGCEVELQRSPAHCGACGNVCPPGAHATPACNGGACQLACETGWGNCDGDPANGCETDLTTSDVHCGGCGGACVPRLNGANACAAGVCVGSCAAGFGDCDGDAANGCEVTTTTTVAHCGGCGMACAARTNSEVECAEGACRYRCAAGFADCDGDAANGCEVDLATSAAHCGACGRACAATNGTPVCAAGSCAITCAAGFGNCDGDVANGCETDTASNALNCGTCRNVCTFPGASARCAAGSCVRTDCGQGLGDCDGMAGNGCETTLGTSAEHCGACGNRCVLANATAVCRAGGCAVASCNAGFADCDGNPANGCEVSLATDALHCGSCPLACGTANGVASCVTSACRIACNAGYGNCDGMAANGCETNLNTTVAACGACGRACALAHATAGCAAGACTVVACDAGWSNCDGNAANGCETDLNNSVGSCGACGRACSLANATPACRGGACAVSMCTAGYGDCDATAANGCETNLNTTVASCGACGRVCSLPNATAACTAGACAVAACAPGFGNCDGMAANGCETDLRSTNSNCGACGTVCGAGTVCSGSACGSICGTGTTYCAGRCVNLASDPAHCGACGTACPARANATAVCSARVCGFTCGAGFGNCDGVAANGCETNLNTTVTSCGSCGAACSLANATPGCVAGACAVASCAAGFGNCDGVAANGCETNTATSITHCNACGNACSVANGTAACRTGCAVASCNAGFGNCDGAYANGCEAVLATDNANCGACGTVCAAGTQCTASRCVPVNDTCQTATPIDLARGSAIDLPFTVVNGDHTADVPANCVASTGADVFFSFTLTQTELVYADTFGVAWDTVLFFARDGRPRGSACGTYILGGRPGEVWCNDDAINTSREDVYTPRCTSGGAQSMVVGRFTPGTYFLAVAGYASNTGSGTIHFQHLPITTNGAVEYVPNVLTGSQYSYSRRPFVTPGTVATTCGGTGVGPEDSFWWRSCPETTTQRLRAHSCYTPTPIDTIIDVRNGSGAAGLCNDDAGSGCSSNSASARVDLTLPAGAGIHTVTLDTYREPAAGSLYYFVINEIIIGARDRRGPFLGSACLAQAIPGARRL